MERRPASVTRTIVAFVVLGVVALATVSVAGVLVIRRIAEGQAMEEAERLVELATPRVQRKIQDGLLTGDAEATASVAGIVFDAVILDPVVGVSILSEEGEIVYAETPELIGDEEELTVSERGVLGSGGIASAPAVADPERFGESAGDLVVFSTRLVTPDGVPLLFQTHQRAAAIQETERDVLATFAPRLVIALVVFAVLAGLLAWGLARRVSNAARERALLLQRAVDASDRERRRIAGDLHDGPIQDLSGLAMSLTARAQKVSDPEAREAVSGSAEAVRASVRTLRSAIVGVYPPNLQQAGLGPALSDLTARLPREGLDVSLDVEEPSGYAPVPDELLYRACQEALRNVESHAQASRVTVSVRRRGSRAVLEVADDGVGMAGADGPSEDGHMGLRILRDLVTDAGGSMNVAPGPGGGTVLRVEVPVP